MFGAVYGCVARGNGTSLYLNKNNQFIISQVGTDCTFSCFVSEVQVICPAFGSLCIQLLWKAVHLCELMMLLMLYWSSIYNDKLQHYLLFPPNVGLVFGTDVRWFAYLPAAIIYSRQILYTGSVIVQFDSVMVYNLIKRYCCINTSAKMTVS